MTIGAGAGGSFSASKSTVKSDFASVAQQSGIRAGDGGFDVQVGGNTDLKGGAITSTQAAIDQNLNRFETATLSLSDIQNKASFSAKSVSVSASSSGGQFKPNGASVGFGKDSGNASSTTLAAISGIAGNTNARTGDKETGIQRIFDADKVQKEINAQVLITQTFGREAPKAAADFAVSRGKDLQAQAAQAEKAGDPTKQAALLAEAKQWDEGGAYRIALQAAVGGLGGGLSGALGAGASAAAAPLLAELQVNITQKLKDAGASDSIANLAGQAVSLGAAAGIGAVAGGGNVTGVAGGFNVDANNRALHPDRKKLVANKVAAKTGEKVDPDKIKSRILFDLGEAGSLEKGGTYNQFTFIPELQKAGLCDNNINACFQIAGTLNGDLGSNKAVFLSSPQDSPAVRYQAAVEFLGGSFEAWLNTPGNERQQADFAKRISNSTTGLVNLSDYYGVALAITAPRVKQEAGFDTGAETFFDKLGQEAKNLGNFAAKGRAAAILNNCTACPQSLQDQPNLLLLAGDIALSATLIKDVAVLGAKGTVIGVDALKAGKVENVAVNNAASVTESGKFAGQFKTQGLTQDPSTFPDGVKLIRELEKTGLSSKEAIREADRLIITGKTLPVARPIDTTDRLYKVVPAGDAVSQRTAFWLTETELNTLKQSPTLIADRLGLPPSQFNASAFDVYVIRPNNGAVVFESRVAETTLDGAKFGQGGATQTLVPNRALFTPPVKVDSIKVR